jgi:flagellum-specific peptidoglycan hydrolase FlgJ
MQCRILFFFLLGTTALQAQKSDIVIAYINNYRTIAIAEEQRTGVPAAIKLAQGIHETQAGTSELVRKSNNHFGIKCKSSWMGEKVYHDDDARGECFRSYTEPEQSYRDHSDFLKGSPRYAFLFQLDPTDYKAWANGLRQAGYATNYRYAQILVKLIEEYNLEQYTWVNCRR